MFKVVQLLLLIASWAALLSYGCNSGSNENSQQSVRHEISGRSIWKGSSVGFDIRWTSDDLFVRSREKVEQIFQPLAKRGYEEFLADLKRGDQTNGGTVNNCDYRRDFQVLSIVGSLLTFEDTEYSDCGGAHPTTEMRFTMVDLGRPGEVFYGTDENSMDADLQRPGKVAKLTDYFAETDILNALLSDRIIEGELAEAGVVSPPRTLAALPEIFAKNDYMLNGSEFSLRPDFLTRFAFHHIQGDMIALRLNLPSMAFAYRSRQIGLLLPIPHTLKQPVALAAAGQEGFVMADRPATIRDQFTRFSFKIGEGARRAN